jgi:hypothetical protein
MTLTVAADAGLVTIEAEPLWAQVEDIEKLRTVLRKIANACTRELLPLDRAGRDAVTGLRNALGVAELTRASVLEAANAMREVLGLSPLTALEATTSLKDGLATAAAGSVSSRVPYATSRTN